MDVVATTQTLPGATNTVGEGLLSYDDLRVVVMPAPHITTTSPKSVAVSVGYVVIQLGREQRPSRTISRSSDRSLRSCT
jgi:hypothetical protein